MAVNYLAPDDSTGYACAANGYIKLLRHAGLTVHHQPLRPGNSFGLWYQCAETPGLPVPGSSINILHVVPEYYPHLTAWLRRHGQHGPLIGMTVWETSRLPAPWPALLNGLDAVIVPSQWNRDVFRSSGVTVPIHVLPHTSEFQGVPARSADLESLLARLPNLHGRYLFYSIGAWSHRKGNDLLLRAFRKAFGSRSDVALILKTTSSSQDSPLPRWRHALSPLGPLSRAERLRRHALAGRLSNVFPIAEWLTSAEVRALHTLGNCYVSCARGEGWGMGLYEALFYGKPAIAPDKGGHREYLRDDLYAGLVTGRAIAVRTPGKNPSYRPDQRWYQIGVREAARTMQQIQSNPKAAIAAIQPATMELRSAFSEGRIQSQMLSTLHSVIRHAQQPSLNDASG